MSSMAITLAGSFVTASSATRVDHRSIAACSSVAVALRSTARSKKRSAAVGPLAIPAGARWVARNRNITKAKGARGIAI